MDDLQANLEATLRDPASVAGSGPLRAALLAAFASCLDVPDVAKAVTDTIGPLADVYERPWESCNPLQRWLRTEAAAADATRNSPAVADMFALYELLVAAGNHSGPNLRLAPGVNVIALDKHRRRYLMAALDAKTLDAVRSAPDRASARRAARRKGSVRYHWSAERTGLVPDPDELGELLPLPDGGTYLIAVEDDLGRVPKSTFQTAVCAVGTRHPVADVVFWDRSSTPPTLWSLRGGFGHAGGEDVEWPAALAGARDRLCRSVWP